MEKKEKLIKVYVTEEEYQKIEKASGQMSKSTFARIAILEKCDVIENPALQRINGISPKVIEKLDTIAEEFRALKQNFAERESYIQGLEERMEQKNINLNDFPEEIEQISSYISEKYNNHGKAATIPELNKKFDKISNSVIQAIITQSKLFKYNQKLRGWVLNE